MCHLFTCDFHTALSYSVFHRNKSANMSETLDKRQFPASTVPTVTTDVVQAFDGPSGVDLSGKELCYIPPVACFPSIQR